MSDTAKLAEQLETLDLERKLHAAQICDLQKRLDQPGTRSDGMLGDRVNLALVYVRAFQDSQRPAVTIFSDHAESIFREPQPKELSALSAACDLLERFFEGSAR